MSTIQNTRRARGVGLGGHDLVDQCGERFDAGGGGAVADHVGVVDVVGGQVGQGAAAAVLELDPHRPSGRARRRLGVAPAAGLEPGLLIGADHVVVGAERLAVAGAGVEVQHPGGFGREVAGRGGRSRTGAATV